MTEPDPDRAVMMEHPYLGAFIRALLPVQLADGHSVTYGVWVGVRPDDLRRAFEVWQQPEYQNLQIHGRLANRVEPWEILGKPVQLAVKSPNETPVCIASEDDLLHRVLTEEWDHQPDLSQIR